MGLLDEVREAQVGRRAGTKCLMCQLVEDPESGLHDKRDRRDLDEALRATGSISAGAIIQALRARGIEATDSRVGNHRRNHL